MSAKEGSEAKTTEKAENVSAKEKVQDSKDAAQPEKNDVEKPAEASTTSGTDDNAAEGKSEAESKQNSSVENSSTSEAKAEEGDKKDDVTSVVAKHYNELEEKGLEARAGSRIFYLRNFNNWTKSMLIGEFLDRLKRERGSARPGLTVLDIGCGKGGDLLKWKKGNIKHLVCADIAEVSLEQCQQRYRDMSNRGRRGWNRDNIYSAEFIAADCTKVRLKDRYKNSNIQFDLVSAQFSFHYCFESFQQAECMIQNASECLRPGGYFIGTTPDGHDIVKRLMESPDLSFGNDVYKVTFETKEDLPLFGAQYNFHLEGVVDCPEFLVYFPAFEKIANDHNLKLVYKKRFGDFFEEFKSTKDGSFLLNRMQALETYPPFESEKLLGKTGTDYETADKKIEEIKTEMQEKDKDKKGQPRVGTLSKSEWEAISMYVAFAFVKVKPDVKKRKLSGSKSDGEPQEKQTKGENGSPEKPEDANNKDDGEKSEQKEETKEEDKDSKT